MSWDDVVRTFGLATFEIFGWHDQVFFSLVHLQFLTLTLTLTSL